MRYLILLILSSLLLTGCSKVETIQKNTNIVEKMESVVLEDKTISKKDQKLIEEIYQDYFDNQKSFTREERKQFATFGLMKTYYDLYLDAKDKNDKELMRINQEFFKSNLVKFNKQFNK